MASRWARLATSGTTPPKRACSSTLLATASARRVWPRTIPTPVSSHDVSMPRTSGSVTSLILQRAPEHHRGGAVAVVAGPSVDLDEAVRGVELERRLVVLAHLE